MSASLEAVDLTQYAFLPDCDQCHTQKATIVGQGCADAQPTLLCEGCLERGLEVIANYVKLWMRCNKRVMICEECHRPMINLETHLDIRYLPK